MASVHVSLATLFFCAATLPAQSPQPAEVLKTNCVPCHNQRTRTSGLVLDSRAGILAGGNRGAAVKPGSPSESLLIQAVDQTGDLKMPPGKRLSDAERSVLREWVTANLPWPEGEAKKRPGSDHWAFQPVQRPAIPPVSGAAWIRNPIDNFILAGLEREGVAPVSGSRSPYSVAPPEPGPHRASAYPRRDPRFPGGHLSPSLRQGGRPPAGLPALRRAMGQALAGLGALRRFRRLYHR